MAERWQMHRAGIFNFWHYEEEEFQLEDGRLILRGANGSGKSVTMQSFLPLVLDGDKRPHRLDPFGSRDRRIEYYLLGDPEDGHVDRTAYLWIEFRSRVEPSGTPRYKTIGIGLRARRGVPRTDFWGFLLDDGRRINETFWLYDRPLWVETGKKFPLSRKALEEKIGDRTKVVQEQAAYRDLVNKALFGFRDPESFQDLLQLMIQLRSPKLSKDFKPSSIYEILTQALPPLKEEELRPLSEVMEDLDQISDRLEEISFHRKQLARLHRAYDRYNRYRLFEQSNRLAESSRDHDSNKKEEENILEEKRQAEERERQAREKLKGLEHRLQEAEAELRVLRRHEAINKQQELADKEDQLKRTEADLSRTVERIRQAERRMQKIGESLRESRLRADRSEAIQMELLDLLEALARETEFYAHDVYHRSWQSGIPEDDRWRDPWRRDLLSHRDALETAWKTAQEERETARRVQEVELELGEARKNRERAERERMDSEEQLEIEKERIREQMVVWAQNLRELTLSDDVLSELLRKLSELDDEHPDFSSIRDPVLQQAEKQRQVLLEKRLDLQQRRKEMEAERTLAEEEKRIWEQSREPEPPRSESRARSRSSRPAGTGAPLYEVCEFLPHVDEELRARVEEALEKAGLLDAWITPDGQIEAMAEDGEEVWVVPDPQNSGTTLADILSPTPPSDSGLTAERIGDVLRTFLWTEESRENLSSQSISAAIGGDGTFRIGPVQGRVPGKERAEFIGKETRRRTRLLEICRLEERIRELDGQLTVLDGKVAALNHAEERLIAERDAFPDVQRLQSKLNQLHLAKIRLEELLRQEERIHERYLVRKTEWRRLRQQLAGQTEPWSRLKREQDLREAIRQLRNYEHELSSLHFEWKKFQDEQTRIRMLQEEEEEIQDRLDHEYGQKEELEERRRMLKAQVASLQRIIEELGLREVHLRISELESERERVRTETEQTIEWIQKAGKESAKLEGKLEECRQKLERSIVRLQLELTNWHREMSLGLVKEWQEEYRPDLSREEWLGLCKMMIRHGETLFSQRIRDAADTERHREAVTNSLLEVFNEVRNNLRDYALEAQQDEQTGRMLIVSILDRNHPRPPSYLLEELTLEEEYQKSLLTEKNRKLFEEVILHSVGKAIRHRIQRAQQWVHEMNRLMEERNTSSGLKLKLKWLPKAAQNENQLDTETLVKLLMRDAHRLRREEQEQIIGHFRSYIEFAKLEAQEERDSLRKRIYELLDYRNWFQFVLYHKKGEHSDYRELTDSKFNVMSGGEKAMAMYIPLFVAMYSRYADASPDAPRIISLDEAFAGVDEENMRDMFQLLTEMGFDYMMTSQVLWGCYDTVPRLAVYEIFRPKNSRDITLLRYRWNGRYREHVPEEETAPVGP